MRKRVSPGAGRAIILIHARSISRLETAFGRCDRTQLTPVDSITPQSPVRIPFPQLEPLGSETTRPWGFVLRRRRDCAAFPLDSKGFATFWRRRVSLSNVARDPFYSHARPSDAPFLAQTLGRLTVSRCLG